VPELALDENQIVGEVLRVDRFGNLVTNIDRRTFERFAGKGDIKIMTGTQTIGRVVATYSDAEQGAICALFSSSEHLEIAVNGGNAAKRLNLARSAWVGVFRA